MISTLLLVLAMQPGAYPLDYGAGCAAVSPDGSTVLGVDGDTAYLYEADDLTLPPQEMPLSLPGREVFGCTWSEDGESFWVLSVEWFATWPRPAWLVEIATDGGECNCWDITRYVSSDFGASGLGLIPGEATLIVAQYSHESLLIDAATGEQIGSYWDNSTLHTGWGWHDQYIVMRAQEGIMRSAPAEARVYVWRDGELALGQQWPLEVSPVGNMTDIGLSWERGWFRPLHWVAVIRPGAPGQLWQDLIVGPAVPLLFDPLEGGGTLGW